jgi:hypothetical protein
MCARAQKQLQQKNEDLELMKQVPVSDALELSMDGSCPRPKTAAQVLDFAGSRFVLEEIDEAGFCLTQVLEECEGYDDEISDLIKRNEHSLKQIRRVQIVHAHVIWWLSLPCCSGREIGEERTPVRPAHGPRV